MKNIFYFGEKVEGFSVRVLNEREARAAAGLLFFFSMLSLLNVFLMGNFYPLKIFVIAFVVDFIIRLFINPKYAPSMILGRLAVSKQKPEYTGASQKKFAWSIGLFLAIFMLVTVVFPLFSSTLTCLVCMLCVLFLFFETAFGICLGCKLYNLFNKEKAKLCPGGVCEVRKKEAIQKINLFQITIALVSVALIIFLVIFGRNFLGAPSQKSINTTSCFSGDSKSPCFGSKAINSSPSNSPCGAAIGGSENTDCPLEHLSPAAFR